MLYPAARPAPSRGDHAYRQLKHRLLNGGFSLNVGLSEERLARALEVSRTPVREALGRLHAEGFIKRGPDGRYRPVAPDVTMIRHLYEVRSALELQALTRPARVGTSHDRSMLVALAEQWRALREGPLEPSPDFVLFDEDFHVTLAEAAGNPALVELLRQVNERIRIVRMQDFLSVERLRRTASEHVGIVEAVLDGKIDVAAERFQSHLARSIDVVEQRVGQALVRMVNGGDQ